MKAHNRTDSSTERDVLKLLQQMSGRQVARQLGLAETTVRSIKNRAAKVVQMKPAAVKSPKPALEYLDKKKGVFNWRDSIPVIQNLQKLRKDSSWGQAHATIKVGDGSSLVAVMVLSDMHIGAMGTDYSLFVELTDIILNTPNLYVAIIGDEVEWAVRLRSVAEVCAQVLDPGMQLEFIESWLDEIVHKVLFATWSNHSTDRSEQMLGTCPVKSILARKVPFFSGIGHAELRVGEQTYFLAASHKFKGVTQADCTAGCKRYLRMEWPQGEIAVQGDCHRAGVSIYNEGSRNLVALSSGTLNVNSGYASRNFSLFTSTAFPVLVLHNQEHLVTPFFTVNHYLKAINNEKS